MNSSTALSLPSPRKQLYFLNPALSSVPPRQPRTGTALRTQTPHAAPAPAPEQPRTSRLLPPPPPGGARPGSRGQPAAPGAAAEAAGPAEGGIHLRSADAVTPRHGPAASPEGATALPARSPRETPPLPPLTRRRRPAQRPPLSPLPAEPSSRRRVLRLRGSLRSGAGPVGGRPGTARRAAQPPQGRAGAVHIPAAGGWRGARGRASAAPSPCDSAVSAAPPVNGAFRPQRNGPARRKGLKASELLTPTLELWQRPADRGALRKKTHTNFLKFAFCTPVS